MEKQRKIETILSWLMAAPLIVMLVAIFVALSSLL